MKKIFIVFLIWFLPLLSFAQGDNIKILKIEGPNPNINYILPNRGFIISDPSTNSGFGIEPYLTEKLSLDAIIVLMVGIGKCNIDNEIIFLFENGFRITKKSWNNLNCQGVSYFSFTKDEINVLRKIPMKRVRLTNGETKYNCTGDVKEKDKRYFIHLLNALDNKIIESI